MYRIFCMFFFCVDWMTCYRSCHHKVMSLWWDAYNGVVPPISQSLAEPTAVGAPCYNRKHLELVWHAPTCQPSRAHIVWRIRGAVGQSCEMGGISHFVRRCTRPLSGGWRATGGHRGREEELEAGKKWEKGAEVVRGEWKREKDEDEVGGKSLKWEMEPQVFKTADGPFLVKYLYFWTGRVV